MRWKSMLQTQITNVRSVSSTFRVVALMYFVMDTPEKLKKAIERTVRERIPYNRGS